MELGKRGIYIPKVAGELNREINARLTKLLKVVSPPKKEGTFGKEFSRLFGKVCNEMQEEYDKANAKLSANRRYIPPEGTTPDEYWNVMPRADELYANKALELVNQIIRDEVRGVIGKINAAVNTFRSIKPDADYAGIDAELKRVERMDESPTVIKELASVWRRIKVHLSAPLAEARRIVEDIDTDSDVEEVQPMSKIIRNIDVQPVKKRSRDVAEDEPATTDATTDESDGGATTDESDGGDADSSFTKTNRFGIYNRQRRREREAAAVKHAELRIGNTFVTDIEGQSDELQEFTRIMGNKWEAIERQFAFLWGLYETMSGDDRELANSIVDKKSGNMRERMIKLRLSRVLRDVDSRGEIKYADFEKKGKGRKQSQAKTAALSTALRRAVAKVNVQEEKEQKETIASRETLGDFKEIIKAGLDITMLATLQRMYESMSDVDRENALMLVRESPVSPNKHKLLDALDPGYDE